jgi:hypothetical protein
MPRQLGLVFSEKFTDHATRGHAAAATQASHCSKVTSNLETGASGTTRKAAICAINHFWFADKFLVGGIQGSFRVARTRRPQWTHICLSN